MILTGDIASIAAGALITVFALWFTAARRHAAPVEIDADERHVRSAARRRALARANRGPGRATCWCRCAIRTPRARRRGAADAGRSRRRGDDGAAARRGRQRGGRRPGDADAVRAPAAVRRRRPGRARRPPGAAADRPRPQRRRRDRRHGDSPARVGRLRRRVVDALGRRPGTSARRGVGAMPTSRKRSTSAWSSITAAAAPIPITSAHIRLLSHQAIST